MNEAQAAAEMWKAIAVVIGGVVGGGFAATVPLILCLIGIVKLLAGLRLNRETTAGVSQQVTEVHTTLNSRLSEFLAETKRQSEAQMTSLRAEFNARLDAKDAAHHAQVEHLEAQIAPAPTPREVLP